MVYGWGVSHGLNHLDTPCMGRGRGSQTATERGLSAEVPAQFRNSERFRQLVERGILRSDGTKPNPWYLLLFASRLLS